MTNICVNGGGVYMLTSLPFNGSLNVVTLFATHYIVLLTISNT